MLSRRTHRPHPRFPSLNFSLPLCFKHRCATSTLHAPPTLFPDSTSGLFSILAVDCRAKHGHHRITRPEVTSERHGERSYFVDRANANDEHPTGGPTFNMNSAGQSPRLC